MTNEEMYKMYQNGDTLCKKVYGYATGNTDKFKSFITGEHDSHFKLEHIKRLCEVVGKPFEETFAER